MNAADLRHLLQHKPIAILGYGASGRGVKALAERLGYEVTCFDQAELEGTRQDFTSGDAHQHAIAIVSPGLPADHSWRTIAAHSGLPTLGELDFGALFVSGGVYVVTGSNGKTTTAEYLAHTLNLAGQNAVCLGSHSTPLCAWLADNLEVEPQTRLVLEIGAIPAASLAHLRIDGLIFTNLYPHQPAPYPTTQAYFEAQWHLTGLLQQPLLIIGQSVWAYAARTQVRLPDYTLVIPNSPNSPHDQLPQGTIMALAPFDENWRLAVALGERIGLPRILWHQSATSYRPGAHCMAQLADYGGISLYNDAKSSTFGATLQGLRRFQDSAKRVLWIGGGQAKGGDLSAFAMTLGPQIESAYLIGATAELMAALLRREGKPANVCDTLAKAVKMALSEARAGDIIFFSPAFSHTDQFETQAQRGNLFEKIVFELQAASFTHTRA